MHTQLPYKYYDKLPFCAPTTIEDKAENLGEILMGDRIENSNYEVTARTVLMLILQSLFVLIIFLFHKKI